ncbi:MAG: UbiA prenyltransferase family protein [Thermoplasmatales archaeon]|nr:MAG: UbiA prenyltransferase family protein [Thermoplasmatales archaeon]
MSKITGILKTLRPVISIVCFIIGAGAGFLAYYGAYGTLPNDFRFVSAIFALWLGTVGSYAINDFFDMDIDKSVLPTRAIPSGDLSAKETLGVGIVLCALSIAIIMISFSFQFAWKFALVALISIVLITVYSSYFKRKTPFSFVLVVIAVFLMPIGIWLAFTQIVLLPLIIGAVYILFEPGFTLSGVCRDIEGDKKRGVPTLPAIIGIKNTAIFALITWILIIPLCIIIYYITFLGIIFLIGSLVASFILIILGKNFVNNPKPEVGSATMIKASLFFWIFNLAIIFDIVAKVIGWTI